MMKLINFNRFKVVFLGIFLMLFVLPRPAYAYLDPGNTSYLFQVLLAGFLSSLFYLKAIIKKIRGLFGNLFSKKIPVERNHED